MASVHDMIATLVIVKDISSLVDLKSGEDPLSITYMNWTDYSQEELWEIGIAEAEHAKLGEYMVQTYGYTDFDKKGRPGKGRIVDAGKVKHHDTKAVVMVVYL